MIQMSLLPDLCRLVDVHFLTLKVFLILVSLSGFINYLDPRTPSKPVKIIAGHNKPITKMVKGYDDSNPTLITAGSDGRVVEWTVADAATRVVQVKLFTVFSLL